MNGCTCCKRDNRIAAVEMCANLRPCAEVMFSWLRASSLGQEQPDVGREEQSEKLSNARQSNRDK
eukprot:755646-Hanusia_phi.AAC.7